jgi:hypothetical protein
MQCLICGSERQSLRRTSPEVQALTAPPPAYDHTIAPIYWEARSEASRERTRLAREEEEAKRQAEYQRYITSDAWRQRSTARLDLDGRRCQAQLHGCEGRATQVHHWTYRHFGNEPLFELVSVCKTCHEQITEMDRRDRAGGSDERPAA